MKQILIVSALVLALSSCGTMQFTPSMSSPYQYNQPTTITTQVPVYNPQTKMVQYYQSTQTVQQSQSFGSGFAQGFQSQLR